MRISDWSSDVCSSDLGPDRFTLSEVDPDQLNFFELKRAIDNLRDTGRPTGPLEAALHHKISGPLAALLMPLLGAVAGFGLARSGKLFVRRSEEHTSELQSLMRISYAVFCLKKKTNKSILHTT